MWELYGMWTVDSVHDSRELVRPPQQSRFCRVGSFVVDWMWRSACVRLRSESPIDSAGRSFLGVEAISGRCCLVIVSIFGREADRPS